MLKCTHHKLADLSGLDAPRLVVGVDTEEEFDWSGPHDRDAIGVKNTAAQRIAHDRLFDRFGIVPTYFVDYSVASQEYGYRPLADLRADGKCLIGTHLHTWVNPPHDEQVSYETTYAGNLAPELERQKLEILTETITGNFGEAPVIYRAGRYGVGDSTAAALAALGYKIDMSVVPKTDLSGEAGPDFRGCPDHPYWFGPSGELLEIPLSVGFVGALHGAWQSVYGAATSPAGLAVRLPGILARLRLLERIKLSPEGITVDEQIRLTKALYARGHRVFSYNYHSPSLTPGNTPYVTNAAGLERFLADMEAYFEFFLGELGGKPSTPLEVRTLAR